MKATVLSLRTPNGHMLKPLSYHYQITMTPNGHMLTVLSLPNHSDTQRSHVKPLSYHYQITLTPNGHMLKPLSYHKSQ